MTRAIRTRGAPPRSSGRPEQAPRPGNGLVLDVDGASFFCVSNARLSRRVGAELKALSRHILAVVPDATVLLTGSFSVGEGRFSGPEGREVIQSDYDVTVVSRRFRHAFPPLVRKGLDEALRTMELSADLEITLVWRTLLARRMTTTGGAIIAGREDIGELLEELPPPRATGALLAAYLLMAGAPLRPRECSILVSKAVMRAAQAILLHRCSGSPRREWIELLSVARMQERIRQCSSVVGCEGIEAVQRAGDELLGRTTDPWRGGNRGAALEVLRRVRGVVPLPACGYYAAKHLLWLGSRRRLGVPWGSSGACALEALRWLTEAWPDGGSPRARPVAEASRLARRLAGGPVGWAEEPPVEAYERIWEFLSSYVRFYPHKLHYGATAI